MGLHAFREEHVALGPLCSALIRLAQIRTYDSRCRVNNVWPFAPQAPFSWYCTVRCPLLR